MSSITDWLDSIVTSIKNLPLKIAEAFLDMLKTLFIPDSEYINEKVEYIKNQFIKLGVANYDMSALFNKETPLSDITCNIMGHEVVIVRMSLVEKGILKFRAIIRGFIILLMVIYNYNQFMGLIGQPPISLGALIKGGETTDISTID